MVEQMMGSDVKPTWAICARFNPKPSSTTAAWSTFLPVNAMPGCVRRRVGCFHTAAMAMPAKMANTGPPTRGNSCPTIQHGTAMARQTAKPGRFFAKVVTFVPSDELRSGKAGVAASRCSVSQRGQSIPRCRRGLPAQMATRHGGARCRGCSRCRSLWHGGTRCRRSCRRVFAARRGAVRRRRRRRPSSRCEARLRFAEAKMWFVRRFQSWDWGECAVSGCLSGRGRSCLSVRLRAVGASNPEISPAWACGLLGVIGETPDRRMRAVLFPSSGV